jgi:hypothetical protein
MQTEHESWRARAHARAVTRGTLDRLVLLRGGLQLLPARTRHTSSPSASLLMVESRTPRIRR